MILHTVNDTNATITISNFQAACVVELLRGARMIEMYHAANKMREAGFKKADSAVVGAEIQERCDDARAMDGRMEWRYEEFTW